MDLVGDELSGQEDRIWNHEMYLLCLIGSRKAMGTLLLSDYQFGF